MLFTINTSLNGVINISQLFFGSLLCRAVVKNSVLALEC